MSNPAAELVVVEGILADLLADIDEIDGRAIWEACCCGVGVEDCAACLRDEVRRKADDARTRLDKVRLGVVAA